MSLSRISIILPPRLSRRIALLSIYRYHCSVACTMYQHSWGLLSHIEYYTIFSSSTAQHCLSGRSTVVGEVVICFLFSFYRPPDVVVGGLRSYRDSFFFLSFVSYLPSSPNGTQPKPATCSEVSAIWKSMPEIWSVPRSKWEAENYLFRRLFNFMTARGLLHCLKISWTLVNKPRQIGPAFLPTCVDSTFTNFAHAGQQAELNQTLPNGRQ